MNLRLTIDDGPTTPCTLANFLAANEFSPEILAELRASLRAHGHYTGGGGAAPLWTITARALRRAA